MRIPGLVIASLIASAPLAAQHWVGVMSGVQLQLQDSRGANNAAIVGTTIGMWFPSTPWGIDITYHQANVGSSMSPYAPGGTQEYATAAAMYNVYPVNKALNFYAKAGVGSAILHPNWSGTTSNTTRTILVLGVGVQVRPTATFMYGAEFQMNQFDPHYHEWPLLIKAAFTW